MAQRPLERDRRHIPIPDWLAARLGIGRAVDPTPEDPADDRALISRALAFLFFAGATLSVIWLKLPHSTETSDAGVIVMTVGAYVVGAVLIVGFDRLPMFVLKASITAATIVITGAILANHENGSTYVYFYFWATVYAFSFFSLRQALGQTALMGVAFGLVLVLQRGIWQEEIARWLLAIGTTLAAGMLVRFLTGTLRHRSVHDPLTGLANRRLYLTALDEALERAREDRRSGSVAVLFLDLDGFKYVNDSLGHHAGDGLLDGGRRAPAAAARPEDLTARFGGDEFALLCADASDEATRSRSAADQRGADRGVPDRRPRTAHLGAASGSPSPARWTATAARCCATPTPRCTRPRRAAGPLRRCSASRMREDAERLDDRERPAAALERDQFEVALPADRRRSPTGRIVGVEALVRWHHPERGLHPARRVHPDRGGDRADRADRRMGAAARLRAARASGSVRRPARRHPVSVNLSARQLPQASCSRTCTALARARIDPAG